MKEALSGLIGVDLGATNVRSARIEDGSVAQLESAPIRNTTEPQDLIDQLIRQLEQVVTSETKSIGIGVPSVVDPVRGIVYDVQNIPSWKEVPLASILSDRFGIPVYINNDANCFALGEKYFGAGRNVNSMVCLILGTGFGSGLILNGKLYSGAHCGAGEVGMLPYKDSIFEYYCSGQFFERQYSKRGPEVYQKALNGDAESLRLFAEFGTHVGEGIKAVLYAYDPDLIVLGGSISSALHLFKSSMMEAIQDFAYNNVMQTLRIEVSQVEHAGVLGAAALALDATLTSS